MGVSRITVREALRILQEERLVERNSDAEHRAVLAAIRDRDGEAAGQAMRHIESTRRALHRLLEPR
jgi:DNA-binding GntR family transcriptional regulator